MLLSDEQNVLARRVSGLLADGTLSLTHQPCICASGPADVPLAHVDRYGLNIETVLCLACGTLRADPYLDEASLSVFYRDYYQELYARSDDPATYFEKQKLYGRRVSSALKNVAPQARFVLEVGCGAGGALHVLRESGLRVAGCDHSERLIRFGKERGLDDLTVGDLQTLARERPDLRGVDILFLHHVFEHLSDPRTFLQACSALLSPSGMVFVAVPDVSRIDQFPFPGGDVRLFLHVAHKFNFSRPGLTELAHQAGFELEFVEGMDSKLAPELWALLRPVSAPLAPVRSRARGEEMLRYLRKTELRYRLGLLPGRHRSRGIRLAHAVVPEKVRHLLRRSMRRLRSQPPH